MEKSNALIGKQIGNYRVIAKLASGGFGSVYRGQHTFLKERVVAIKILHTVHLGSQQESDNFLQEAQFLERLKHPHILPLLDFGIYDDFPYLIAEYASGGSLRDRLRLQPSRPLPLDQAQAILVQIGQALQLAHQQNVVHRDLKPENILFHANGAALLADFGIATALTTASVKYLDSTGTPAYMAPEQFRGMISKASDQYALGCIAYELFTGQRPFIAPDFVAMGFKHATENPTALRHFNPQIPLHIEQAVLKAIAKERADRHADVATFIAALQSPAIHPTSMPALPNINQQAPIVRQAPAKFPLQALPPFPITSPQQAQPSFPAPWLPQVQAPQDTSVSGSSIIHAGDKVVASLGYLAPTLGVLIGWPILALIVLFLSRKKHFTRFHFMQSLLFSITSIVIVFAAYIIDINATIGGFIIIAYWMVSIIFVFLVLLGKYTKIPIIGELSYKFANRRLKQS